VPLVPFFFLTVALKVTEVQMLQLSYPICRVNCNRQRGLVVTLVTHNSVL